MEASGGNEALHHGTVRQTDREWESWRKSDERENEKKNEFFFLITVFLIFFNYPKKKNQNDIVLAHLTAIDNWGLTEYRIDNIWKLEDWNEKGWKLESQFCIFAYLFFVLFCLLLGDRTPFWKLASVPFAFFQTMSICRADLARKKKKKTTSAHLKLTNNFLNFKV